MYITCIIFLILQFDEPSKRKKTSEPIPSGYNPLPASRSVVGQHRGIIYMCMFKIRLNC